MTSLPNPTSIIAGYLDAAFFTDTGEGDQPPSDGVLSDQAAAAALVACAQFCLKAGFTLISEAINRPGYSNERLGHDLWLTRNGHGVGFWDRKELEADGLGDKLSDVARSMGEVHLRGPAWLQH